MATKDFYSKDEVKDKEAIHIPLLVMRTGAGIVNLDSQPIGFHGVIGECYFHFPDGSGDPVNGFNVAMNLEAREGLKDSGRLFDERKGTTSTPAVWWRGFIWGDNSLQEYWWGRECQKDTILRGIMRAKVLAGLISAMIVVKVYVL